MDALNSKAKEYQDVQILVVDDDEVSVMAIKRALKQMKLVNPIRVARDGIEGLEILRGEAGQEQLLPPFIVLLDINMPRMNGHEFLKEIRNDARLHRTVIFVLTTSDTPKDVNQAYSKNVAGYVVKERPFETFSKTLEMVDHLAKLVVLPD